MRNVTWFMHNGAPSHFSVVAPDFLTTPYQHRWVMACSILGLKLLGFFPIGPSEVISLHHSSGKKI